MPILFRDFETRSSVDLRIVGAWRYAADPTTEVLCVGYAVDAASPEIWTPGQPIPDEFLEAARNPDWLVVAHNDQFETAIEQRLLGPRYAWPRIPLERHRDTMAMALAAALPAGLENAAAALGLPFQKDRDGYRLMRRLAQRRTEEPDPGELERLCAYCRRDVEVERALFHRLPALSAEEQRLWLLDAEINGRGLHVDRCLAEASRKLATDEQTANGQAIAFLTNGEITSANQVARIQAFVEERGHQLKSLSKRSVSAVLAHGPDAEVKQLLELRRDGSRAAARKLDTLLAGLDADDRLRGTLRYHGAATGRWSGSRFQPQNLKKPETDIGAAVDAILAGDMPRIRELGAPLAVVGDISRAMICAAPGHVLIGADFSAIESRVLAWIAGETWKLDSYRQFDAGGDPAFEPYCVTAARILKRPVTPEDEAGRKIGKTCDLAFGYGGGLGAWRKFDSSDAYDDTAVEQFKAQWRSAHKATTAFWYALENGLRRGVRTGQRITLRNLAFEITDGTLYLTLPSGRRLAYPEARLKPGKFNEEIEFKDNARGAWNDVRGWHGTFTENVVQAISRDLLAAAMVRLEAAGYHVVLHVHDEVVCEVPEDFGGIDAFVAVMLALPDWAAGLPLAAKGWRRQRYAKTDGYADSTPPEITNPRPSLSVEAETTATSNGQKPVAADFDRKHDHEDDGANGSNYHDGADDKDTDKPYPPVRAALSAKGYRVTQTFLFTVPGAAEPLFFEDRYELRSELTPTKQRPKKTSRYWHRDNGEERCDTGPRRIIYNWPAIMQAGPGAIVFVTEGANKSVPLNDAHLLATAAPYHQWGEECIRALTGDHLIYLADHNPPNGNDPGPWFAEDARKKLAPRAASFRIVPAAHLWKHLPRGARAIEQGDDVKDWIELGGDLTKLLDICHEIPPEGDFSTVPLTIDEWLSRDLPAFDPLIGNVFSTTTRALLAAPTGIGKTNFGMALWGHAGLGRNFLHWHVPRLCRMLFIDGEMSRRLLRERIEALTQHLSGKAELTLFFNKEDIEGFAPLNTSEGQAAIWKLIEEVERRLSGSLDAVCFDNIVSLLIGDMKEEDAWRDTMPMVRALTKRRIGQLWLHHTGHDTSRGYGTKTREWQLDLVLHMTEVKRPDTDVSFTLSFPKARERTPDNRGDFTDVNIALVDNQWVSEMATAGKEKPAPLALRFFEALQAAARNSTITHISGHPAASLDEWQAQCVASGLIDPTAKAHIARSMFSKYKQQLIAANWIAANTDTAWILP